jgi:Ca2+-binding RTX toxin-like protein
MTTKHNLTSGKDKITGNSGVDLFVGTKGELGSNDVLNGGGGIDTISAELSGKHLVPTLKNIEKGIFTHKGGAYFGLDLLHAQQMTSLALKNVAADAVFTHATHVKSIALSNVDGNMTSVTGIDAAKVGTERVSFSGSIQQQLDLQTKGNAAFDKLDITLDDSQVVLKGDLSAETVSIHSLSKQDNSLSFQADSNSPATKSILLDGSAALTLYLASNTAQLLKTLDASKMDGALTVSLDAAKLTTVRGGSDNDVFYVERIGGDQVHKGKVDMGAGNDKLVIDADAFDNTMKTFDGGTGRDTLVYTGVGEGISVGVSGFEVLQIKDASGTFVLDADWQEVDILGDAPANSQIDLNGGSALTLVKGSAEADWVRLFDLGGTASNKAQINLGGGNDFLDLTNLQVDASTQHFNGGSGDTDFVRFSGHISDIGGLFTNFEYMYIDNAQGSYDFTGSGIKRISLLMPPAGAMSLNGVANGTTVDISNTQTTILTVNVENAATLQFESFSMYLSGEADFGNSTFGLVAPNLSSLNLLSYGDAHTVYLSEVGSSTDLATLSVSGNAKLTLIASNASTMYIDQIVSTNTAGLDMLGLLDGTKALSSSGVTISGGGGADVLVGGVGNDTISSGGGNNTIHGSLGVDHVDISAGGLDTLVFHSKEESSLFSGDTITGFNIFDAIDISDVVSSVTFGGNFANFNAGLASLSLTHSVGFFDMSTHTLYVDVNEDGALSGAQDMAFHLDGLDTFQYTSLIG